MVRSARLAEMSASRRHRSRRPVRPSGWFRAAAAACSVFLAAPALAAPGALLEVYFGPSETDWLDLQSLQVELDGKPLPVRQPARGADPAQAVYSGPVAPGPHRLEVRAALEGESDVFTYVEKYLFKMAGHLDVVAPPGQVTGVQARVIADTGFTTRWEDRYRLALSAASYPTDRAPELPDAPPPAPTPEPVPAAPAPAPAAPAACSLDAVHFAFDKAVLTGDAKAALDRFASCLAGSKATVRLDGHCDPRGSEAYNLRLGAKRAAAVLRYLTSHGVAAKRLTSKSFGESRLACTEATEDCHAMNRRVEAQVSE